MSLFRNLLILVLSCLSIAVYSEAQATDLKIEKTLDEGDVITGQEVTYTIKVTATGQDAINVTLSDAFPQGVTVNSSLISTTQGTCQFAFNNITQTVNCSLGNIPAGSTATVEVGVKYTAEDPFGTIISNTATVAADNAINTGDDSSTADFTVVSAIGVESVEGCGLHGIRNRSGVSSYALLAILLSAFGAVRFHSKTRLNS
jgi:conserved repeat domain